MTKIVAIHGQQKWEYCTETRYTDIPFLAALNERGQQGWEVIDIVYYKEPKSGNMAWMAIFKRPSVGAATMAPGADMQAPAAILPMEEHHSSQQRVLPTGGEGYQLSKE